MRSCFILPKHGQARPDENTLEEFEEGKEKEEQSQIKNLL